jgi:hypothetical protein
VATDRSFGVSTAWDRVLHWREERVVEELDAEFTDADSLAEALAVAAAQQFGGAAGPARPLRRDVPTHVARRGSAYVPPTPVASQAALLVSIFLGGLAAALMSGRFRPRMDMGDGFRHLVTGNPLEMVAVLFLGGVLVGFGTRLAGGCSSGHGLSGCARLYPASILATAVFFGAAVLVSFLLWKVI